MKNFKKILSMVLAAVLLVVLSVGATVAYLTYEADPVENTFTVGDISIGLTEEVKTEGAAKVTERVAGDNQNAGGDYTNIMPGDKLIKIPTVTNTGANPAYVALTVTVNNLAKIREVVKDQEMLDKIFTGWDLVYGDVYTVDTAADAKLLKVDEANETAAAEDNWFEYNPAADTAIFTYYLYLENQGDSFTPFEEINVPAAFSREQLAMFEGLNIKVEAAAIQADNVPSAMHGFAVLNGVADAEGVVVSDAASLEAALATAKTGDLIVLEEGTYGPITIDETLSGVIIDANGQNLEIDVVAGASLTDVIITDIDADYKFETDNYRGVIRIAQGADVKGLVIKDSTFNGTGARSAVLSNSEPTAEVTITNCVVDGPKYFVYSSSTPMASLTIENCTIENLSSWVVLQNKADTFGAKLTITGNTINNCRDGIAKYLGSTQPDGAATVFVNNTLTNCAGHDGSDAKWFTIPGPSSTITVSGNTLDGAAWTPGTAQGLGK